MSDVPDKELQQNLDSILNRAQSERVGDFPARQAVRGPCRDRELRCGGRRAGELRGFLAYDPAAMRERQITSTRGSRGTSGNRQRKIGWQARGNQEGAKHS